MFWDTQTGDQSYPLEKAIAKIQKLFHLNS